MKKPKPATIILIVSIVVLLIQHAKAQSARSSSPFTVLFPQTSSLGFDHLGHSVVLSVTNGDLNCSNSEIALNDNSGYFRFTSNETVSFTITFNVTNLKVQGDQGRRFRIVSSPAAITANAGNNVFIQWDIPLEPWLPLDFLFLITGLMCMFAGPLFFIQGIKQKDYEKAGVNGAVVTALGIALVLGMLWI